MVVKSRKVSNAIVITIPSSLNVPENVQFEPSVDENGNILLTKVENIDSDNTKNIHEFMDRFKPLMEKLKDR